MMRHSEVTRERNPPMGIQQWQANGKAAFQMKNIPRRLYKVPTVSLSIHHCFRITGTTFSSTIFRIISDAANLTKRHQCSETSPRHSIRAEPHMEKGTASGTIFQGTGLTPVSTRESCWLPVSFQSRREGSLSRVFQQCLVSGRHSVCSGNASEPLTHTPRRICSPLPPQKLAPSPTRTRSELGCSWRKANPPPFCLSGMFPWPCFYSLL